MIKMNNKRKPKSSVILTTMILLCGVLILPQVLAVTSQVEIRYEETSSYEAGEPLQIIQITKPKSGKLYIMDVFEIPILFPVPVILGKITCIAEAQHPNLDLVDWAFVDYQGNGHDANSHPVDPPYYHCTYSLSNYGLLVINARAKDAGGSILDTSTVFALKFF